MKHRNVKIKLMKKIFLLSFLLLFLSLSQVQAAGLVPCGEEGNPCQFCHFFVLINNIIEFVMFKLVPVIAVVMLIVGGIMFFFAGAKPDVLTRAKGIITSVVIGLVVIFCAWLIVNTVLTKIGIVKSPSLLQWYQIECPIQ